MHDHDARITANEDDIDDNRATVEVHGRRLDEIDRRLRELEAVIRRHLGIG
jgi:hypothetical protein